MPETKPGRIVVRGGNIMQPPLLDTDEARLIEFRDGFGDMFALFCRILSENTWGLVLKDDPDWHATLVRYGYVKPDKSLTEVIREA